MIAITGATGTVGSALVDRLASEGVAVRAVVRDPEKRAQKPNVTWVAGDLSDPSGLDVALHGATRLFLLSPFDARAVEMQLGVLEAARRVGVRHVVKLSALGAGTTGPAFLTDHHRIEKAIEESGLAFTHLRPNGFFQNLAAFYGQAIAEHGEFAESLHPEMPVSMIDVRDVAAVAAKVLTSEGHEGKTYELTGPEAITRDQMASTLGQLLGKRVRYVPMGHDEYRAAMISWGVPEWQATQIVELCAFYNKGAARAVTRTVDAIVGRRACTFKAWAEAHRAAFEVPKE
jgi:uncharacterized protein YbjT (DUF2867 family)